MIKFRTTVRYCCLYSANETFDIGFRYRRHRSLIKTIHLHSECWNMSADPKGIAKKKKKKLIYLSSPWFTRQTKQHSVRFTKRRGAAYVYYIIDCDEIRIYDLRCRVEPPCVTSWSNTDQTIFVCLLARAIQLFTH